MLHPHPGLSHIPVMTVDPVERDPAQPQRVEAEVRRAALSQLLKGGVLAGIVAGATGTLVGDRRSFRYLLVTVLAPLPVGILLQGHSRPHLLATLLIALFAWGMDRVHQRTYRTFADRVRAAVLLESSTQELARQHAYLDALIASTPVAIAVLDNQRSVRSVNPAFETLFGYSVAEVVGAKIDALIVPAALRSESSD